MNTFIVYCHQTPGSLSTEPDEWLSLSLPLPADHSPSSSLEVSSLSMLACCLSSFVSRDSRGMVQASQAARDHIVNKKGGREADMQDEDGTAALMCAGAVCHRGWAERLESLSGH